MMRTNNAVRRLRRLRRGVAHGPARRYAGGRAWLWCLAVAVWILLPLVGAGSDAFAAGEHGPTALGRSMSLPGRQEPEPRRLIIQLEAPAAAAAFGSRLAADRGPELQAELGGHLDALLAQQDALAAEVMALIPGAEVAASYRWAFNGLAVSLPEGAAEAWQALDSLPGVQAVYEEVSYRPALYSSLEAIAAPSLWTEVGGRAQAGEGVRIAVLDNGIDVSHPMFDPETFDYPDGYPLGDEAYTTAKVIVARAYFRHTDPPLGGEEAPVPGPFASAHGTHVAAVAAGIPVTPTVDGLVLGISGVAPRAQLMNYRIFYPGERTKVEEAHSVEVLEALEDAIADGADVILSSWESASPRLPLATAEAAAVRAAIEAGIVVVSAAGNGGPAYGSASRLLGGDVAPITVGAVTKSPIIARNLLDVTSPSPVPDFLQNIPLGVALFGTPLSELFGPKPFVSAADIEGGTFGLVCAPLPDGSLEGQVVLVKRGGCPFADKVYYAERAGAVAVIIQNYDETVTDFACGGDFCDPGEIRIPAVMVGLSDGKALASWRTLYPTATLQLDPGARLVEATAGAVSEASARGPAFMRYLKPDLVAPGVAVLSAGYGPEAQEPPYVELSGTSVAAAHAAGAAALLLQAHPDWGHAEVKAALMGAATVEGLWADAKALEPAGVLSRGAGRIDLAKASSPPLLIEPPSISLPEVRAGDTYTVVLALSDTRTSGPTVTVTPAVSVTGMISISLPGSIEIAPGETVTVSVRITVNTGAGAGDATADLYLAVGGRTVHAPLWAHVKPAVEAADVLLIDNDFSNFDTFSDYSRVITPTLQALSYSYAYWDADLRFDSSQTIPDLPTLQRYPLIIWLTGDNKSPYGTFVVDTPLTPIDLQLISDYLDGGGRLLAIGQNVAQASDVNPNPDPVFGRADLYHDYLGARWLQGNVFAPNDAASPPPANEISVVGLGASPMNQIALDLGPEGDGDGNQTSIDEIAPGGLPDDSDLDLVRPILQAVNARPLAAGYVGVAKGDDPTIEERVPDISYRSMYLSFGVEGVNNRQGVTTRTELLGRALDWLSDEVTVDLVPIAAGVGDLTRLEANAASSVGAPISRYRWQIMAGEAVLATVASSEPFIVFAFPEAGEYTVAVEASDALGHTAVDEALIMAVPGGGSTLTVDRAVAAPGDLVTYRALLRNSGHVTATVAFTLTVPEGTTYVSHAGQGATFDANTNTLSFSGTLAPKDSRELGLTVRIADDVAAGAIITATGRFAVDTQFYELTRTTLVLRRAWLPIAAKSGRIP